MAKLTLAVVLLLIAAAAASTYTTEERCERDIEQQMPMRNCKMYMQSRMRWPYRRFDEERLQKCCGELRQLTSECRCDAVREMMMGMQQCGEMERMASSLPRMCGMSECQCRCKCGMSDDSGCRCRRRRVFA